MFLYTHVFFGGFLDFFYNFKHFERHFVFQKALNYIFSSRKPEKILCFTSKLR